MAEEWDEEYGQIPYYARGFALQRVPVSQIASPFINPIRQERIDELAELEDEGHELPPVILDGPGEVEEVDYPEEKYPFLDGHFPVVGEDVWYVHDGHHRVTLAVQRGQRFIDALIIGTSNEMERNGPSPLDNPAFRRWFKDSKVVDEAGDPLVVWHAAPPQVDPFFEFDSERVIDIGFHFGTEKAASEFGNPRAFYLSIQNPIELEDPGDWFYGAGRAWSVQDQLVRKGLMLREQYEMFHTATQVLTADRKARGRDAKWVRERAKLSAKMRRLLLDLGFDGVRYKNESEDYGSMSWIVFDPRQIKSATDNVGTFDPADPSILRNPSITETPSFKAWFKDSKVRDRRKGNAPLVVYHGTPDGRGIFSEGFRRSPMRGDAFFATDSYAMAASYADANRAWDYQNAEPGVIPLYLSIQSPLSIDWGGKEWRGTEKWIAKAREQGADGLIVHDVVDYYNDNFGRGRKESATVYVWFSPTQAKSAAAGPIKQSGLGAMAGEVIAGSGPNEGTFDPADPVITKNRRTSKRTSRRRR